MTPIDEISDALADAVKETPEMLEKLNAVDAPGDVAEPEVVTYE